MTSGYELSTALTNLIIAFTSFYAFIRINKKNKLWELFFLLIGIDGMLGFFIHGISYSKETIDVLWYVLSLLFCISVNTLLAIFFIKKKKISFIILSSLFVYLLLFIETVNGIDFLFTFIIYACVSLLSISYSAIKNKNKYIIYGIIFQIIGGIFLIGKINLNILDKNGIYHLFMVGTVIMFYLSNKLGDVKNG